jgi:hypothetical protein
VGLGHSSLLDGRYACRFGSDRHADEAGKQDHGQRIGQRGFPDRDAPFKTGITGCKIAFGREFASAMVVKAVWIKYLGNGSGFAGTGV